MLDDKVKGETQRSNFFTLFTEQISPLQRNIHNTVTYGYLIFYYRPHSGSN